MKKNIVLLIVTLFVSSVILSFTVLINALPIGSELPKADLKMKSINGKEISMKDEKNKNGLLVMFSCNQCPYVIKNQQRTKSNLRICT